MNEIKNLNGKINGIINTLSKRRAPLPQTKCLDLDVLNSEYSFKDRDPKLFDIFKTITDKGLRQ